MPINETAKLLRVHLSENDLYQGRPLYQAIVDKCREMRVSGATVFRGLKGYGETAELHRHRLMHHDQPILITVIEQPEILSELIPAIEAMMDTGLMAISDVEIKRVRKS